MHPRTAAAATIVTLALVLGSVAHADDWAHGEFQSGGKPVEENHCVPSGASDRITPASVATDLDEALTKAGRPHEKKISVGVQHGFNIPHTGNRYDQSAANDAWDRSLKFLDTYLKGDSK